MDDELLTLIQRTIHADARQRVDRILTSVRSYEDPQVARDDFPTHGVCRTVEEVPSFRRSHLLDGKPYWFQYGGKVHWWRVPGDGHRNSAPWLITDANSYHVTPYLQYILWEEYAKDPIGPRVPSGYSLEPIGNKQRDHESLLRAGCVCEYRYYNRLGEVVSVARAYSLGFIDKFSLPGGEVVSFDTLDEQSRFLRSLASRSEPDRPMISRGDKEHHNFLASLKAQCLAIRDQSGPSHSRAAFEIYKTTAKYLTG